MGNYFMPIYTTLVGTIIGMLVAWLKSLLNKKKEEKSEEGNLTVALKEGMAIMLKKQLFEYYAIYEYRESIPVVEWEEIVETYKVYKKLGGNHSGDRVYKEMESKHLGGE